MFFSFFICTTLVDFLFDKADFIVYSEKDKIAFLKKHIIQSLITSFFVALFLKYVKLGTIKRK